MIIAESDLLFSTSLLGGWTLKGIYHDYGDMNVKWVLYIECI